jgi:glutamate-ammonia-ligase adenylyltransferase
MTARSDLDLMTLYSAANPAAISALKDWSAETFFARFTQRLTTALSAPTAEGGLYQVDLQLRPSGRAGPVAVSLMAFEAYYDSEAETWEALALTRARVVWASSPEMFAAATETIVKALRQPRDPRAVRHDVFDMRALMRRERPAAGAWDLKLADGGLVDIEFAAQALQIVHGARGGPLLTSTSGALAAMEAAELADTAPLARLGDALRLQSDLFQILRLALPDRTDPKAEPPGLQALLARAGGAKDFASLQVRLTALQQRAHQAYGAVVRDLA